MKNMLKCLVSIVLIAAIVCVPAWAAPATGGEKDYLEEADLIWLGADYFAGEGAELAQALAKEKNETFAVDAAAGATIAGDQETSYAKRADALTNEDKRLLLVELTGNDLDAEYEWGDFSYTYDKSLCDTSTIIGALDYIFNTARDLEMTGVVVIPKTEEENEAFPELVERTKKLQEKWGFDLIDLRKDAPADALAFMTEELGAYLTTLRYNYKNMFIYAGNLPQFDPEHYETDPDSDLKGLNIIQLGSSVSAGAGAMDISFVEYIAQMTDSTYVKEAVPGTTMSNYAQQADTSYINRMLENLDPGIHADLFLCQLSTNDASKRVELGEISDSENRDDYDLETVAGAIQFIISYVQETWGCPIVFYTGTKYSNEAYGNMVDLLLQIGEKYDISIIDMYHNLDTDVPLYEQYISFDGIHPTKRGYAEWWTPYMISCLEEIL